MATVREYWEAIPTTGKLIIGGVAVVGLYRLGKKIFSSDKGGGNSQNISCGNNLTFDSNQYKTFADTIEVAIWGTYWLPAITEDDEAIGQILKMMNTTDDVCTLVQEYGYRSRGTLFNDGGNLVQMIHAYLDSSIKAAVNADYVSKGINWVWM